MKSIDVRLCVMADGATLEAPFKGAQISTPHHMSINAYETNRYIVVYRDSDFIRCTADNLLRKMITIVNDAITDTNVMVSLDCISTNGDMSDITGISDDAYVKIMQLDALLDEFSDYYTGRDSTNTYKYIRINTTMSNIVEYMEDPAADLDDDDEPYSEPAVQLDLGNRLPRAAGASALMEDDILRMFKGFSCGDDYKPKKKSKNKLSKSSGPVRKSYSLIASKSPKAEYKRHGVIVVKDKDPIKHDAKIIMGVLKKFIPGDQSWKKDFRKDLAERWLGSYVVTKKKLERLEKEYKRQKKGNKKSSERTATLDPTKALRMTEALLGVHTDSWSDPRR